MHAILAILLSGPKSFTSSERSPTEPPPDMGRMSARGRISGGILKNEVTGERMDATSSIAPDSVSMADAESIATSAGKIEKTVLTPSSTPFIKAWYTLTFRMSAVQIIRTIKRGTT